MLHLRAGNRLSCWKRIPGRQLVEYHKRLIIHFVTFSLFNLCVFGSERKFEPGACLDPGVQSMGKYAMLAPSSGHAASMHVESMSWDGAVQRQYLRRQRFVFLARRPHVAKVDLWKTSGHYDFYRENMFDQMDIEDEQYQLRPM